MAQRWDDDDRGHGIGDAAQLVAGATELVTAFQDSAWVTEQPEAHLRPHVEGWCQYDRRLELTDAYVDDSHAYVLQLEWRGAAGAVGEARAAIFSLIGSFAETATYIRQRREGSDRDGSRLALRFEVGTGELALDGRFAPHGHALILYVNGVL